MSDMSNYPVYKTPGMKRQLQIHALIALCSIHSLHVYANITAEGHQRGCKRARNRHKIEYQLSLNMTRDKNNVANITAINIINILITTGVLIKVSWRLGDIQRKELSSLFVREDNTILILQLQVSHH